MNRTLAIPLQPLLFNRSELAIPVSDDQLARLDERRAGNEPRFTLHLWGTAQETATGTLRNVRGGNFPTNVQVPRDQWLVILKACGFGERLLIELPAPPTDLAGDWKTAAASLAAAANRLAAGEPGVALGEVRIALERIADGVGARLEITRANASGKKMPLANYVDVIASDLKKRHFDDTDDPFAVLSALFKATFGFCSEPGHTSFDVSARNDAVLALSVASALYSYLARFPIAPKPRGAVDASG